MVKPQRRRDASTPSGRTLLAQLLAATTQPLAANIPHATGFPLTTPGISHVKRWCTRIERTHNLGHLHFGPAGVRLANSLTVPWLDPMPASCPELPRMVRDIVAEGRVSVASLRETAHVRELYPWEPEREPVSRWCGAGVLLPGAEPTPLEFLSVARIGKAAIVRGTSEAARIVPFAEHVAPEAIVRWCPLPRHHLEVIHAQTWARLRETEILGIVAHEWLRAYWPERYGGTPAWPEALPWSGVAADHPARELWPSLRAMAWAGMHLLAYDNDTVSLGVELLNDGVTLFERALEQDAAALRGRVTGLF